MRLKVLVLLFAAVIGLTGCGSNADFNEWTSDCIQAGGIVALSSADHYDCFIDNEIKILPGWEGY